MNNSDNNNVGRRDKSREYSDGRKTITITASVPSGDTFPVKPGEEMGTPANQGKPKESQSDSKD